jgi:hypothetical protein
LPPLPAVNIPGQLPSCARNLLLIRRSLLEDTHAREQRSGLYRGTQLDGLSAGDTIRVWAV